MIFDTHAHYEDEAFDGDREEVIRSLPAHGVKAFVNVASDWRSLERTKHIAENCDFARAAYGIHPDYVDELSEERMQELRRYGMSSRCVAVGEIGLDYHHGKENRDAQLYWFARQIDLARELSLPVIIHSRDAAEDTIRVVRDKHVGETGGVVHCYSYSPEIAREFVSMGLMIGVGGVVTFKNARKLKETVKTVPLDHIVLETDCPYMAPEPFRGTRNTSANLPFVVQAVADLRGITAGEVEEATWQNALRLYRME